jgi:hypothetical protein
LQEAQIALANTEKLRLALASKRTLREEVGSACIALAQNKDKLGVKPAEKPLWKLLSNADFQDALCQWMMVGAIPEGDAAKTALLAHIRHALAGGALSEQQLEFLQNEFFTQLEKAIFANDILARWRHQLSLTYLQELVLSIQQRADEAVGIFSHEKQKEALDRYCEQALKAWDIIDLNNLPENDVDIATQNLLMRQLYMPLRIRVEKSEGVEDADAALAKLEAQRDARRRSEAGHTPGGRNIESDASTKSNGSKAGIGELLQITQHLVVLGDPGGGKTTMLRWLATAMLLRYRNDPALGHLPDVATLPTQTWIPVLIRCRDLGEEDLCRCFSDFLSQHLLKTTLLPDEAQIMRAMILEKIVHNQVLLMVDGLDEITLPHVRVQFCQELERTAARYPALSIIVTSRIVGYRDMPYRMGRNFQHGVISELSRADKDLFAKRWIEATEQRQTPDERAKREHELVEALHASDRIERLTGNPMLLTTLALVKRKVGKLPSRRNKLYAEAVAVLLNWNPVYYEVIDEAEALPQLEYIAFEMCRLGVQRLTDDEILTLLERFRVENPSVRAVRKHTEAEFLALLEARSSILIKAGSIWKKGQAEQAAWEFRHLTFQEYLAARALVDGKYPGRDKTKSLAEQVAPLAGAVREVESHVFENEAVVPESWREALRLLVADCHYDDVDDVLAAILTPLEGEDKAVTQRTRAVLATLCLADEPNAGDVIAGEILCQLMEAVRDGDDDGYGDGDNNTSLVQAALELNRSNWAAELKRHVVQRFLDEIELARQKFGSLWGNVAGQEWNRSNEPAAAKTRILIEAMQAQNRVEATAAALTIMDLAFNKSLEPVDSLVAALLGLMGRGAAECNAATWALGWLYTSNNRQAYYRIDNAAAAGLCNALSLTDIGEIDTQYWIMRSLGQSANVKAVDYILPFVEATHERPRNAAITALGRIGDARAIRALTKALSNPDRATTIHAAIALSLCGAASGKAFLVKKWHENPDAFSDVSRAILTLESDAVNKQLLSDDIVGLPALIKPKEPITPARVLACAKRCNLPEPEIRQRYEAMAPIYGLTLSWLPAA